MPCHNARKLHSFPHFLELPQELQTQIWAVACFGAIVTSPAIYDFTEAYKAHKILYSRLSSPRTGRQLTVFTPPLSTPGTNLHDDKAPLFYEERTWLAPIRARYALGRIAVCKLARQVALEWWRKEVQRFMIPAADSKYEVAIKHLLLEILGDLIKQVRTKHLKRTL